MIKKIKSITIEKLIFFSIMVILIGIPAIILFRYTMFEIGLRPGSIDRAHLLWAGVPVLFTLYIADLVFNKKKITYADIMVYLLIILAILSTIFAINTKISIIGTSNRNEGLLSLLSYYFILLNLKNINNEKYKKVIIKTIIILGIVSVIYGILQVYTNFSFITHARFSYMASGLIGNPNFFGSYMVILASLSFSMYMLEEKRKYLVLSIIFFIGLCLSSSAGPFISFILVIIFFIIFYRKKINWKKFLMIIALFGLVYFSVDYSVKYVNKNIYNKEIDIDGSIVLNKKDFNLSHFGNGRIKLWKNSIPLLKDRWAIGRGLDNYTLFLNGVHYDKAHNVYLQIAITNGIFALIIYLALMAIIFFKGLKIKEKFYISLLMAFIGYSIQAFANISVIEVAPTYFVICGLLLGKIQNNKKSDIQIKNN